MSVKLEQLIQAVRTSRTSSEEREIIRNELAQIRTKFAQEDAEHRARNVAKLLFIQLQGYPVQFAQLECLKLVSTDTFIHKRIGYLGLMMMLDEESEVLLLVPNTLKNDLSHPNMYVQGLALCTLGNICNADMARDLAGEVFKLLSSTNNYVRKKAAICAQQIIRKCPDLMENFVPRARNMIVERHHGVLLTGIGLLQAMCEVDEEVIPEFRKYVPALVRTLKALVMSGYAPEHDVGGVTDPFVQVAILKLLRTLGRGNVTASDQMNDVLAHVATNTQTNKNVGNAILYEVVQTIMNIEAESGLRLLAINILGRFLLNRDNNIRYVALNTLSRALAGDLQAVQRHRSTITQCLKDPDISIRRRALELTYLLVNDRNAHELIGELCLYVEVIDPEFRINLVTNVVRLAQKFSQGDKWHANLALRVLKSAGAAVTVPVQDRIIALFGRLESQHSYIVKRLYEMLDDSMSSEPLKRVGAWCIGEFGDLLLSEGGGGMVNGLIVSASQVVAILDRILDHTTTNAFTKQFVLTALAKLLARLPEDAHARIRALINEYRDALPLELQQHACEYLALNALDDAVAYLERMPPIDEDDDDEDDDEDENSLDPDAPDSGFQDAITTPDSVEDARPSVSTATTATTATTTTTTATSSLLDLTSGPPTGSSSTGAPAGGAAPLLDLLGGSSTASAPNTGSSGGGSLLDLLSGPAPGDALASNGAADGAADGAGDGAAPPAGGTTALPQQPVVVYEKNNIQITYEFAKKPDNPAITAIQATFRNANAFPLTNFSYKLAVPQYMQLHTANPSGNEVPASNAGVVTQMFQINNTLHGQQPVLLKFQVQFNANAAPYVEQGDVSNLPPGL